jgi:hypothetical protein
MSGAIPLFLYILQGIERENFTYKPPGLQLQDWQNLQTEPDRRLQCHCLHIGPSHTEDLSRNNPSKTEIYLNYTAKFSLDLIENTSLSPLERPTG